jgi:N-acyl-D-amino-acid deacylase
VPAAFDLVIRHGRLIDGTGVAAVAGDVAVRGDRIEQVGTVTERGAVEVDARGLAVSPGFIDVHTHDDFAVVLDPEVRFKTLQGVTSEVVGNCGMGAAPYRVASLVADAFHPGRPLPEWDGYAGYLERFAAEPASVNVAALVGHGTVRGTVLGGAARAPSGEELARMRELVREGLAAGAVGYSSGLVYDPGRHADTDELVALAEELAEAGGLYATHMRDEGEGLLGAVREAISIGERAGVPVQISHHKAAGKAAWGLVQRSLRLIEEARERGVRVTADQYPYTAGSTVLRAVVQHAERLGAEEGGGRSVVVVAAPNQPEAEGRSLTELGAAWGCDAITAAERVLERDPNAWAVMHSMNEDDVCSVMRHPTTMIGSDGIPTDGGKPHPRLYGTFARVLGHYVRAGVLGLEEAVHRMTGFPAATFGLAGRGRLEPGAFADLVLFDPARIDDVSTYEAPRHHPPGIHHVFVNGAAVVRDGEHTGARPGRALRRVPRV